VAIEAVNRASRDERVDAVVGGVRLWVVEDIERPFILAYVDAQCLAGSHVDDGDPERPVDLALKVASLKAVRQAAVEFGC
jgi:hypothetical protein